MSAKPAKPRAAVKSASRQLSGRSRSNERSISPIILKFREIFPQFAAAELMKRISASYDHCEKVIDGRRGLGAEYQAELLRSDVGGELLPVLMGQAAPGWFVAHQRARQLADVIRKQAELSREVEALQRSLAEEGL